MDRATYAISRVLQMLPALLGVVIFIFLLLHMVPGDPAVAMLGVRATPDKVEALHQRLGLDKPLWEQFIIFFGHLFRGDLGQSIRYRTAVINLLPSHLEVTVFLVIYGGLLSLIITVPTAFLAALRKDGLFDQLIRAVSLMGLSMPAFWIGVLLLIVFGIRIPIFPVGGYGQSLQDKLYHLFLPAFTIAIGLAPILIRSLRTGIIDVLYADYVDFARAKGLRERLVMTRHILRNAMLSTTSIFGVNIAWLIGGTVVIESVFALPGLGFLMVQSIYYRDYPVVQAVTLIYGILVMAVNLLTDITYSFLDPRVAL
jgi:peptide/nickel transport system permease protein